MKRKYMLDCFSFALQEVYFRGIDNQPIDHGKLQPPPLHRFFMLLPIFHMSIKSTYLCSVEIISPRLGSLLIQITFHLTKLVCSLHIILFHRQFCYQYPY